MCTTPTVRKRDVDARGFPRSRSCLAVRESPRVPEGVGQIRSGRAGVMIMDGPLHHHSTATTITTCLFDVKKLISKLCYSDMNSPHAQPFVFADTCRPSVPIGKAAVCACLVPADPVLVQAMTCEAFRAKIFNPACSPLQPRLAYVSIDSKPFGHAEPSVTSQQASALATDDRRM